MKSSKRNFPLTKPLLINVLAILLIITANTYAKAQVPASERDALIALYNATNGSSWTNAWDTGQPVSNWFGITITAGRVTAVELQNNNLDGTIPAEIGQLGNLQILNLSGNNISDDIPDQISLLTNLQQLLLQDNKLNGEIPPEIYTLKQLQTLRLSNNGLDGTILSDIEQMDAIRVLDLSNNQLDGPIPPEIGSLLTLREIKLSYNNLINKIPPSIGNLTSLTSLSLEYNQLSEEIPSSLGNLSQLTSLSLSENELEGEIPSGIFNLTKLTGLYLMNNNLRGQLPEQIGNLINLQYLNLQNCGLSGSLPSGIGNLTKLRTLLLGENNFTGSLSAQTSNFTSLINVNLEGNKIENIPVLTQVSSVLKCENNNLGFDDLELNVSLISKPSFSFTYSPQANFGTEDTFTVVEGSSFTLTIPCTGTQNHYTWYKNEEVISNANDASSIYFGRVSLSDSGMYHITVDNDLLPGLTLTSFPVHLEVQEHCRRNDSLALVALYNATDGPNWTRKDNWLIGSVGTWFGIESDSCNITSINLYGNGLSGILPAEIGDFEKLDELILTNNNLSGTIPPEIENLTNLRVLHLDDNNLTGSLPPELWNLTSLESLLLNHNPFAAAEIPSLVSNLQNLSVLGMAEMNLNGTIPEAIYSLSKLQNLALYGNNLSGTISTNISNLSELRNLYLNSNLLTGSIPAEIGTLSYLQLLNLQNNMLSGSIPPQIGDLLALQTLYLEVNQLSGEIPSEIGDLINLKELRLHDNQLSGDVPAEMGDLSNLTFLNLANNEFTGNLPATLGNLDQLHYANFADNLFTGNIPPEMENFSDLEFLFLNNNSFQEIPALVQVDSVLVCQNNKLTFEDLERNLPLQRKIELEYEYSPQQLFNYEYDITVIEGNPFTLSIPCGGEYNHYTWFKNNFGIAGAPDSSSFLFPKIQLADSGTYHITVINDSVINLTLKSFPVHLHVIEHCIKQDSLVLVTLYNENNGINWHNNENWLVEGKRLKDWFGIEADSCNITGITLDNNNLTGTIPPEIGSLTQLEILNMKQNSLSGNIPNEIYGLSNLKKLNLGKNQLDGTISGNIGQLTQLNNLLLNDNEFRDKIPNEIGSLSMLKQLDLSNNNLDETIPSSIDGMEAIVEINLGNNQLTDPLPDELWNLTTLNRLLLDNNEFSGELSALSGKLTELTELRIDSNFFTGSVPAAIGQLSSLKSFQFDENLFDDIPQLRNVDSLLYSQNNYLTFEDFERNLEVIRNDDADFQYSPQYNFGREYDTIAYRKYPFSLSIPCGGQYNHYKWFKDGVLLTSAPDSSVLTIQRVDYSDAGNYHITVTNDSVPNLELTSLPVTVIVEKGPPLPLSLINLVIIDGSHNPVFVIDNIDDYPENRLVVFNKWGNQIFDKISYNNELDLSTFPEGTYYFILNYTTNEGKKQVKNFVDVIKK